MKAISTSRPNAYAPRFEATRHPLARISPTPDAGYACRAPIARSAATPPRRSDTMAGYDHGFTAFDERVPYAIRKVREFARSESLAIFEKPTGRVVKAYDRNYPTYGTNAFYPFRHRGRWYAFMSAT
jgi:hypothetical protein